MQFDPYSLTIRTADFLEAVAGRAAIIIVAEAERTDRERSPGDTVPTAALCTAIRASLRVAELLSHSR
jgi:hypothetical protein